MIAGFAMVASPADYGVSGVMTVVCSHHGGVFRKNLGERTAALGRAMKEYDPDRSWTRSTSSQQQRLPAADVAD